MKKKPVNDDFMELANSIMYPTNVPQTNPLSIIVSYEVNLESQKQFDYCIKLANECDIQGTDKQKIAKLFERFGTQQVNLHLIHNT